MLVRSLQRVVPRHRASRLALWYAIAAIAVTIDYLSGPFVQFPVVYVLPVVLAAWFDGRLHAMVLAVVLPLIRLGFSAGIWSVPWTVGYTILNAAIRMCVFSLLAYLTTRVAERERAMAREVSMLERILPICSHCKRIRDHDAIWHPLETYLRTYEDLLFSHGVCPSCAREHYGEYIDQP